MAAYCRVYDSHHLQADCQEPGSALGTLCSVIEYGLPLPFLHKYGYLPVELCLKRFSLFGKVQRAVFRFVPIDSVLVTQLKSCFSYVAASMYHSDVWHWQLSATSSEMYEICLIVAFSLPSVL